jgi:hypothetical protein
MVKHLVSDNQWDLFYSAFITVYIFSSTVVPIKFVQRRFTESADFEGHIPRVEQGFAVRLIAFIYVRTSLLCHFKDEITDD